MLLSSVVYSWNQTQECLVYAFTITLLLHPDSHCMSSACPRCIWYIWSFWNLAPKMLYVGNKPLTELLLNEAFGEDKLCFVLLLYPNHCSGTLQVLLCSFCIRFLSLSITNFPLQSRVKMVLHLTSWGGMYRNWFTSRMPHMIFFPSASTLT